MSGTTAIKPAQYKRAQPMSVALVGKTGVVVAATYVHVASPAQVAFVPYSYVLVEIDGVRHELMGVGHDELQAGDKVECVWRRLAQADDRGLIEYGVKVQKIQKKPKVLNP